MSVEKFSPKEPQGPVAVCLFKMPEKIEVVKKNVEGFDKGYLDAHLTKESPTVQPTIKTSTEGGVAIPVFDPGNLFRQRVPRGSGVFPPGSFRP